MSGAVNGSKMGRPKAKDHERMSAMVKVFMTQEQFQEVMAEARSRNCSLAQVCRNRIFVRDRAPVAS